MNNSNRLQKLVIVALAGTASFASRGALADDGGDSLEFQRPTFKVSQEVTHIVKGGNYIKSTGLDGAWIEPTSGSIDFLIKKNRRLGIEVMVAGTYFAAPYHYDQPQNFTRNVSVSVPRLNAGYLFGDPDKPSLKFEAGIMAYKYDEYARDLGEYMFRTWAYPGIMVSGGLNNYLGANTATITGAKFSQNLGSFSHDLMATIETDLPPVYDLNLTYMAKVNLRNVLKVGAGVQLARALSADKDPLMTVHYFNRNGIWFGDVNSYYKSLKQGTADKLAAPGATAADSTRLQSEIAQADLAISTLDSLSTGQINPELKRLTARAIKPVFYFSFDPKPLMGTDILGPKDMVLYGEAAILGVKNYPVFYTDMARRIPMMVGFNLPAFKALDVLSVELEYYGSRGIPAFKLNQPNAAPSPVTNDSYYPSEWDKDNFKWSVSAERTLIPGVTLTGQVASDHARSWDWTFYGKTPWEIYTTPSQYYWGLKLTASI